MRRAAAVALATLLLVASGPARAECPGNCNQVLCSQMRVGVSWALVEGIRTGEVESGFARRYQLTAIHGGPAAAAVEVGDEVETGQAESERALLVVSERGIVQAALEIYGDDRVRCRQELGTARRVDAIDAALSGRCYPRAAEAGLSESCTDAPPFGCATGGGKTTAAGLLASALLVAGTAVARVRRRAAGGAAR